MVIVIRDRLIFPVSFCRQKPIGCVCIRFRGRVREGGCGQPMQSVVGVAGDIVVCICNRGEKSFGINKARGFV